MAERKEGKSDEAGLRREYNAPREALRAAAVAASNRCSSKVAAAAETAEEDMAPSREGSIPEGSDQAQHPEIVSAFCFNNLEINTRRAT